MLRISRNIRFLPAVLAILALQSCGGSSSDSSEESKSSLVTTTTIDEIAAMANLAKQGCEGVFRFSLDRAGRPELLDDLMAVSGELNALISTRKQSFQDIPDGLEGLSTSIGASIELYRVNQDYDFGGMAWIMTPSCAKLGYQLYDFRQSTGL